MQFQLDFSPEAPPGIPDKCHLDAPTPTTFKLLKKVKKVPKINKKVEFRAPQLQQAARVPINF